MLNACSCFQYITASYTSCTLAALKIDLTNKSVKCLWKQKKKASRQFPMNSGLKTLTFSYDRCWLETNGRVSSCKNEPHAASLNLKLNGNPGNWNQICMWNSQRFPSLLQRSSMCHHQHPPVCALPCGKTPRQYPKGQRPNNLLKHV